MNCIKCWVKTKQYNHCDACYNKQQQSLDYQDIVNKNTSKFLRRKYQIGNIRSNALECLLCKSIIRSKNVHNFVRCKCWECGIDWGSQYVRVMWEPSQYKLLTEQFDDVLDYNTYREDDNLL